MEDQRRGSEECQRGEMIDKVRKRNYSNDGTIESTTGMAARAEKPKRRMDLSTEGKESDLATIAEEVEAKCDCLIEERT